MKKKMNVFGRLLLVGFAVIALSSCYSTTTCVGTVTPTTPMVKVNSVKNHFLINGLVPISKAKVQDSEYVKGRKNYAVKKELSFIDGLLGAITFGIYTPSSTVYYVPVEELGK